MAGTMYTQAEYQSEERLVTLPDFGDSIDILTFEEILDMDDDDNDDDAHEFSRSIVFGFFTQAEETFLAMDNALKEKDLATLSSLGHFLKGSSATLGATKVKDSCANIEHFGRMKDENGISDEQDKEKCLSRITQTLKNAKEEYATVQKVLKRFYINDTPPVMISTKTGL